MQKTQVHLQPGSNQRVPQPSIADRYADLLALLDHRQRQGLIVRLTVGYYDGWRPSRSEVADLVAEKLKIMPVEEVLTRQLIRSSGGNPSNITNRLLQNHRHQQR
jgi:uncharacterized protein YjhX (UPF0386 family)